MSYKDCIERSGLSAEEFRIYDAAIAEHQAAGMNPEEAQRAAIQTRLDELAGDKAEILAKVNEGLPASLQIQAPFDTEQAKPAEYIAEDDLPAMLQEQERIDVDVDPEADIDLLNIQAPQIQEDITPTEDYIDERDLPAMLQEQERIGVDVDPTKDIEFLKEQAGPLPDIKDQDLPAMLQKQAPVMEGDKRIFGQPDIEADQTQTEAFKNWFGDSKVVDDNGEPLVVYHGTGNLENLEEFKPALTGQGNDQLGSGFYFTTNKTEASGYTDAITANVREGAIKLGGDTSPGVSPVFISMENPIEMSGAQATLDDSGIELSQDQAYEIMKNSPDVYDMENTPLWNWFDIGDGHIEDFMLEDVASNYTGVSLISLENDFFSGEATAFRTALNKVLGYDGVIQNFDNGESHYVAWFPEQIKSAIGNIGTFDPADPRIMNQPTRASIELTDKNESIIRLTQASDLSSFLHESGHLFLEMERRFAEKFGQSKEQKLLLDWLGVESFEDITVKEHEKFAETFEVYLREGKALSLKLREAFSAFARWLTRIYRSLTDPRLGNAELTPEIREYMDRMLATEVEIEQAMANPAYDQLFRSKEQAGMTDAEFEKYQKQANKVKDAATIDLNQKVIDELRKRKTKEWNEEKAPLIDEEKARLGKLPVYQVLSDTKQFPMDYESVKDAIGFDKQPGKLIGRLKKGGENPEAFVEAHGFSSVKSMVTQMIEQPALKKAAEDAAEARMIEKYGDMLNDGRIELEAREAVHNEEQAKLLIHEIKGLSRKKSPINREYLKAESKRMISEMKYKEIKPNKYYHAEIKAAKKAATATTDQDKLNAKIQQLANHYLYRDAVKALETMDKQRKQIRAYETREYTPKSVVPSYAQNIKVLAKSYNMRKGDARRRLDVEQVVNWMITQMDDPNNYVDLNILDPNIIEMIVAKQDGLPVSYELPQFDDLTARELKGLNDQLRHMRFVGGKLSDSAKNELMVTRQNAAENIDKFAKKKIKPRHYVTTSERIKDAFLEFGYSHRRIGGIFETLDGFKKDGPMSQEYERITDASNKELELTDMMAKAMDDAFKGVLNKISKWKKESITKADGVEFTLRHRDRFVLALNWGNQGNRDAIIDGLNTKFPDNYTEADIVKMIETMSNDELHALNKIWKAKESLWPHMSKVEVNRKGVAPQKVEATPFEINGIKLTGGHYRLHYMKDPADSSRTEITTDRSQTKSIKVGTASSMNERVGSGGRQVDLELGHLFQDISEEIHYIAYAELSDHLNSMFKGVNNDIVNSIIKGYGQPYYDNLANTLSTLTQPEDPAKGLWRGLKFVRSNLTYGFLAGSIRNVIQQPIAVTNAIAQLGGPTVLKGAFEFYRNPSKNWGMIREKSAFMRNRTALVNREAREQLLKIDAIHPAIGAMKNAAFAPQTFMDTLIAFPTWMGAMSKYKKENPNVSEKKAMDYADDMVAKTIGSGLSKDVGAILNKGEAEKQITFMGTFFNLTWNLHVENAQLLKNGDINAMEYARRLGWMAIAPALLSIWVLDDIPEDDDEILSHILKEIAYYNMSSVFLIRDLAGAMDGFNPSIPGLKWAEGTVRVSKEMQGLMTGDEEFDANTVASILRGAQPLAPLPFSGQVARTLEGMADPEQGFYGALVEGKERN